MAVTKDIIGKSTPSKVPQQSGQIMSCEVMMLGSARQPTASQKKI